MKTVSDSSSCYDLCSQEQDCLAGAYEKPCETDCTCYLYKNDYIINNDNDKWETTFKTYDDLNDVPIERDCFVSDWLDWSACVNSVQQRERSITLEPTEGGKKCPSLTQTRKCDYIIFM
jgi:hypothetical protein